MTARYSERVAGFLFKGTMREIDKVLDEKEKVLWEGKPKFWPFLLGGSIVTTIFGLFWMLFFLQKTLKSFVIKKKN